MNIIMDPGRKVYNRLTRRVSWSLREGEHSMGRDHRHHEYNYIIIFMIAMRGIDHALLAEMV